MRFTAEADHATIRENEGLIDAVLPKPLRAHRCSEGWKVETGDPRFGHVALALSKQDADKLLTMM